MLARRKAPAPPALAPFGSIASRELTPHELRALWRREKRSDAVAGGPELSPRAQRELWRRGSDSFARAPVSIELVRPAAGARVMAPVQLRGGVVTSSVQALLFLLPIALGAGPTVFEWQLAASLGGLVGALWIEAKHLPRWRLAERRRQLSAGPRRRQLDDAGEGERVRVRGRVLPQATFPSLTGTPAVLVSYVGTWVERDGCTSSSPHTEVHARNFQLLLEDGPSLGRHETDVVTVAVANLALLSARSPGLYARPTVVTDARTSEVTTATALVREDELIQPGDLVELEGEVHRTLTRDGGVGSRTPRLELVLRGRPEQPLLLRRLT